MFFLNTSIKLILPILIPILGGACIPLFKFKERSKRQLYVFPIVLLSSLITLLTIFITIYSGPNETLTIIRFSDKLNIAFRVDGLAATFGALVAVLWPLATCYAFEYMKHEGSENKFYTFYTMTFGITLAIAFSANLLTLYLFYELLTIVTLPLVIHTMDKKSLQAGEKYLLYSVGGASLIFIGLLFIIYYGYTLDFRLGGVLSSTIISKYIGILLPVYVFSFFGTGVKAAIFPFHGWLPTASVAPTTVTALLHAVAVVKAGVFTIIRVTYYSFGTEILRGTSFQEVVMVAAMVTILYGSLKAYNTTHLKRRLAYSTISQLSYIVFAATLMTPIGMQASLFYLITHAFIKIVLFYCAGAVYYKTQRTDIKQLAGLGRHMPITFGCFTIAALSLMGLPPTAGFIAKLQLLTAVVASDSILAWTGLAVIVISIFLTGGYMFSIIKTAFFDQEYIPDSKSIDRPIEDPNMYITIPLIILSGFVLLIGIFSYPILEFFAKIAWGGV